MLVCQIKSDENQNFRFFFCSVYISSIAKAFIEGNGSVLGWDDDLFLYYSDPIWGGKLPWNLVK